MNNDLISREALKKAISDIELSLTNKRTILDLIDNAPTVEDNERPQGEWICITKSTFPQYQPDEYKCSRCNKLSHIKYYFCPFCGADMKKEVDNGK